MKWQEGKCAKSSRVSGGARGQGGRGKRSVHRRNPRYHLQICSPYRNARSAPAAKNGPYGITFRDSPLRACIAAVPIIAPIRAELNRTMKSNWTLLERCSNSVISRYGHQLMYMPIIAINFTSPMPIASRRKTNRPSQAITAMMPPPIIVPAIPGMRNVGSRFMMAVRIAPSKPVIKPTKTKIFGIIKYCMSITEMAIKSDIKMQAITNSKLS